VRPWTGEAESVPVNAGSRRPYRGINSLLLGLEAMTQGYARNAWLTLRQANELGGRIRVGSRGVTVVFYKFPEAADEVVPEDGSDALRRRVPRPPLLRAFTVFNVAQIDGLPERMRAVPAAPPLWEPQDEAEHLLEASGAEVRYGGSRAFYSPQHDHIQLPEPGLFVGSAAYYGTLLHELVHWTGHAERCDRQLGRRFGQDAYAMEELVAEIGSAFLCAHCRIDGQLQHAAYVASWLRVLKSDKRAVFTASAKAQAAADWILARARPGPQEEASRLAAW
jgi:antirestriction protein ArdC